MNQNRGPGNKTTKLNPLHFNKGGNNIIWGEKKRAFSTNDTGKTGFLPAKGGIRFVQFTLYKNQFKMNQRPETSKI